MHSGLQRVQEPFLQGLSAFINLAGKLVKDITNGKVPDTHHVLDHVMESVALFLAIKEKNIWQFLDVMISVHRIASISALRPQE